MSAAAAKALNGGRAAAATGRELHNPVSTTSKSAERCHSLQQVGVEDHGVPATQPSAGASGAKEDARPSDKVSGAL